MGSGVPLRAWVAAVLVASAFAALPSPWAAVNNAVNAFTSIDVDPALPPEGRTVFSRLSSVVAALLLLTVLPVVLGVAATLALEFAPPLPPPPPLPTLRRVV